jgi:hypothetical protein
VVELNKLNMPHRRLLVVLGSAIVLMSAPTARASIISGGSGQLNGSPVNAYVELDASQHLLSIGFQLSGAAVRNPGTTDTAVFLTLPIQASVTPFTEQAFLEGAGTQTFLEGLTSQQQYILRQPSQYALPSLPALVPHSYQFSYDRVNDQYFMSIGQFASTAVPEPGSLSWWGYRGSPWLPGDEGCLSKSAGVAGTKISIQRKKCL